jgi:hypothetical protein
MIQGFGFSMKIRGFTCGTTSSGGRSSPPIKPTSSGGTSHEIDLQIIRGVVQLDFIGFLSSMTDFSSKEDVEG